MNIGANQDIGKRAYVHTRRRLVRKRCGGDRSYF